MLVVLVVAVVRHELRRGLARGQLGHEHEHLARAEALVDEVERRVDARARMGGRRLDLGDLLLVRHLDRAERGLSRRRLLDDAARREIPQKRDDDLLAPHVRMRGRARRHAPAQRRLAPLDARHERLVDRRVAVQELALGVAQQIAQLDDHALLLQHLAALPRQRVEQQADQRHALVELGLLGARDDGLARLAVQDRVDLVVRAVLLEQRVVHGERVGDPVIAQKLAEQLAVDRLAHLLVQRDDRRQVLPAARRHERLAAAGLALHLVEAVLLGVEERRDRRVQALLLGVALPHRVVGVDVDLAHTVERHDVELVHRAVVLGRVARAHHDPALGHLVLAEFLELQELQHRGVERLRHAVDLVEEQDALAQARARHVVVHRRDDLGHRVLRRLVLVALEIMVLDARQAKRALARVVRHRVRHDADAQLAGDLLHDGGLTDAGRAQKEHRALMHRGDHRQTGVILFQIRLDGVFDLLFG